MSWQSVRHVRLAMLTLGLSAGCSEERGPVPMPTTRVTGFVHEGRRPIRSGWVEFLPIDGTVGLMRSAPIRPDGTFSAERVPVGEVAVGINGAAIGLRDGRRIFDSLGSPIRRRIKAEGAVPLDIDIFLEYAEFQALLQKQDR